VLLEAFIKGSAVTRPFHRIGLTTMCKHMPFEAGITTKCLKADMAC